MARNPAKSGRREIWTPIVLYVDRNRKKIEERRWTRNELHEHLCKNVPAIKRPEDLSITTVTEVAKYFNIEMVRAAPNNGQGNSSRMSPVDVSRELEREHIRIYRILGVPEEELQDLQDFVHRHGSKFTKKVRHGRPEEDKA